MLISYIMIKEKPRVENAHDIVSVPQINLFSYCFERIHCIISFTNMQNYIKKTKSTEILYFQVTTTSKQNQHY